MVRLLVMEEMVKVGTPDSRWSEMGPGWGVGGRNLRSSWAV